MPKVTANICKNQHGKYYFRLVIPIRFRIHFPETKREIRRSLKTDSQSLAIKRARLLRVRCDLLFEEIDKMNKSSAIETGLITEFDVFGYKIEADFKGDFDKEIEYVERKRKEAFEQKLKLESIQPSNSNQLHTTKISELAEAYLHVKSEKKKVKIKTSNEYRAACETLTFILGDIELGNLTTASINQYYDSLRKLPANRNTSPLYKGKTSSELELLEIDKTISTRTANKIMGRINGLLKYAFNQQIITNNLADCVILEKETTYSKKKREAFTDTELKKIFESPHFTQNEWRKGKGRREPYRFWLPLIALFTGARLAEICQLNKSDITKEDDMWIFNITDETDPDTGRQIKSVKNQNSIRKIPISQILIDIGLIKFRESIKTKELFPELKSKKNGIDSAQKWVNNLLKRCNVHHPYTKTFHSLRHTFVTNTIGSGIEPKYVGGITGHLSREDFGQVAEIAITYFKGYEINLLKTTVIDRVEWAIDFSSTTWK